ncbi:MAG: InlB B-repeat-containing protein [Clostridia bacterium]|nr:InlB B-repeat-containing protein [Clostridia bacterium]
MKKIISVLLLIVLTISLSACNKSNNTSSQLVAGSQSDVSSMDILSQSTTTSTEVSESTQSTNTTPSKTEEPKPTVVAGEYTVIFDYGYDNKKITAKSKNYKVAKPGNPTREGYDFCGWYAENEDACWNFAGHVVTEDMTLTARWQERMVLSSRQETTSQETTIQNAQSQVTQNDVSQSQVTQSQNSSSIPS